MTNATKIQAKVDYGYAKAASILGQSFDVYRSTGSNPIQPANQIAILPGQFTNAKASGFNFEKSVTSEDLLWTSLIDIRELQPGDFLVGSQTYFLAAKPPLLPPVSILCSHTVSQTRTLAQAASPGAGGALQSQPGSSGTYFGRTQAETGSTNQTLLTGIPCAMIATPGRATGKAAGQVASDAPGPSRWRIYLPVSSFPEGSLKDRDDLVDEEGYVFQVAAAVWTPLGYRAETIRLES